MPEEVPLCAVAPRGLEGESYEQWIQRVRDAVKTRQDELAKERQQNEVKERRNVLGVERVLAMDPLDSPKTEAPRWGLRPHLACRDKDKMEAARQELTDFRGKYREMRQRLREGEGNVVFPAGTYRLRLLGLPCKDCLDVAPLTRAKPPEASPTSACATPAA